LIAEVCPYAVMDPSKKQQLAAAPSPEKRPSTLLDAYEVECIRRELESLLLKQNAGERGAASGGSDDAAADILGLRRCRRRHGSKETTGASNTNRAPAPAPVRPAKKLSGGGTGLHLGKHAVKICGGAVAVSPAGANGRRPRRVGYREVEKM
jgi:hypothetical protein